MHGTVHNCHGNLNYAVGCLRDHRLDPSAAQQQRHSGRACSFAESFPKEIGGAPEDTQWLIRFGDKHWTDHLIKAAQDFKFKSTLKPRLDIQIQDWHDSQPDTAPRTVFEESSDPGTTPLGGPMSIRYEWEDESKNDPTA